MDISLVIPAYNESGIIMDTIQTVSARLAELTAEYEVLIVDDGSTDGTGAVIDRYVARDARIVARTTVNQGPSKARMEGLAVARG